jgi:thiamine pyrophosphate-dependent acetolactate synthase large subunit-like protein
VVGDGGGMMRLVELWTAVRLKLRFVVVVLNDACYGMEYHTLSTHGVDPKYSLCDWPEFADVARSPAFGHTPYGISANSSVSARNSQRSEDRY